MAFPIIYIFIIWSIVAFSFALKLSPLTKEEEILDWNHPVMISNRILNDNYGTGGAVKLLVNIYWGVDSLNSSKAKKWDPEYIGEVIWDKNFDLSPIENQQNILDFCEELKRKDFVVKNSVICWTEMFQQYLSLSGQ